MRRMWPPSIGRMKNYFLLTSVALALAGCGGSDTATEESALQATVAQQEALGDAPQSPSSLQGMGHTLRNEQTQSLVNKQSVSDYAIDTRQREAVRLMYQSVFAASNGVPPAWVGDVATCNAGTSSTESKDATLRRINWFRAMAGVPAAVQWDATFNQKAQQAALMMAANNKLSHTPPTTWKCYTAVGAEAANKSNISLGRKSGVDTVTDGYMRDPGSSNAAVGHRRWLLYPQTRFMGTGDVNSAAANSNAIWVMDGNFSSPRPTVRNEFVSWPPPGFVPYTTVYPRWSFSYPRADFSAATVAMTQDGVALATRKETLRNGTGENTLVWFPGSYADGNNWARPTRDTLYRVTVGNVKIGGVARTFTYDVNVFDPDVETSKIVLRGSDALAVGQPGTYTFDAIAGADAYQWRSVTASPYALNDSAEAGTGNFNVTISSGYDVNPTGVAATGSRSFRLQHATTADQILQLKTVLVPNASSQLRFSSRLGYATANQRARVEASVDDGKTWVALYEQAGTSSPEAAFSSKAVSLAAFAGRTTTLRLRYMHTGGSYYSQSSSLMGWYVDDVAISGTEAATTFGAVSNVNMGTGPFSFNFVSNTAGTVSLQARPGMYGHYAGWGPLKPVRVGN